MAQADSAGCPAVGTFRSCAYGCNRDRTREARWPRDKYVLGYWGGNWTVAGGAAWEELRGLLTGWLNDYNTVRVGSSCDFDGGGWHNATRIDDLYINPHAVSGRRLGRRAGLAGA